MQAQSGRCHIIPRTLSTDIFPTPAQWSQSVAFDRVLMAWLRKLCRRNLRIHQSSHPTFYRGVLKKRIHDRKARGQEDNAAGSHILMVAGCLVNSAPCFVRSGRRQYNERVPNQQYPLQIACPSCLEIIGLGKEVG